MLNHEILFKRPHLLEAFLFCEREFFLETMGVYNQDNTPMRIGDNYHEKRTKPHSYAIKVDKINWERNELIEIKKRTIGEGAIMQTYLYLKMMQNYSSKIKRAVITSVEKHQKIMLIYPDSDLEKKLTIIFDKINHMEKIPARKEKKGLCGKCSLFDYCWVD